MNQTRRAPNNQNSRIHNSFDSKLNFLKTPDQMMPQFFQQNRQPVFDQLPGGFHSQFVSPFASMLPIINSQSFDPILRKPYVNSSLDRFLGNSSIGLVSGIEDLKLRQSIAKKPPQSPPQVNEPLKQPQNTPKPQSPEESQQKWISFKDKINDKQVEEKKQSPSEWQNEEINEVSESWSQKKKKIQKRKRNSKRESVDSESFQIERYRKSSKQQKKLNDTKNITKNFSKAIISFILQKKEVALSVLDQDQEKYEELAGILKKRKNTMTNIKQLRELWTDSVEDNLQKEYNKAFRIIRFCELIYIIFSQHFLKNLSICYIYNSRISNTQWHLKYRQNLLRAIKEPDNFKYIKDI